jgi:putative transposase
MVIYSEEAEEKRSDLQIAMPRLPRLYAPEETIHVVARCNNHEFCFKTSEDFEILLDHLGEMSELYELQIYAYTLMANHIHLLLRSPAKDPLGRPLRWFMTQTAKTFNRLRNRSGHFWERRYRACLVEDDLYALAALRYLDRNPVRARIVENPTTYQWSTCASYALGVPNRLIHLHPTYLSLSPYPEVRQRHYCDILCNSPNPIADGRDPRWTTQPVVGSLEFLNRRHPASRRKGIIPLPESVQRLSKK